MLASCSKFGFCVLISGLSFFVYCSGQYYPFGNVYVPATTPLPFPACKAIDIDCQRRRLRTFFFLMDSRHLGMSPVDPMILNSVAVSYPHEQYSIMLRRVNVTGARWTKLVERRFNLEGSRSGVQFNSDLHVTALVILKMADRFEPYFAHMTMDIQDAESNITYKWEGQRGYDNEDYLIIGPERIAVRNSRIPTYFMQPDGEESSAIDQLLQNNPTILDHLSIEIVTSLMHNIVDNFRNFAKSTPVKYYYEYY